MISEIRTKAALGGSMVSRILAGMGSIIMLAWFLDPRDYGLFVTVLAAGQIISVLTSFGFAMQILRDVGESPDEAGELLAASVRIKNILVAISTLGTLGLVTWMSPVGFEVSLAVVLIYFGTVVNSYNDIAAQAMKGLQRFELEAANAVAGNLLYLIAIVVTAYFSGELVAVGAALLVSRSVQSVISFACLLPYVKYGNLLFAAPASMLAFVRSSSRVGVDSTLTAISSQIDVLLISAVFGLETVGAYQIISRLSNYAMLPAQLLISAFVPRLAGQQDDVQTKAISRQMRNEFVVVGLICAVGFASLYVIYPYALAAEYQLGLSIWFGFFTLILVKYLVALQGVHLVLVRRYGARVVAQVFNITVIVSGFALLLPYAGLWLAPWVLICAYAITGVVYRLGYHRVWIFRCD